MDQLNKREFIENPLILAPPPPPPPPKKKKKKKKDKNKKEKKIKFCCFLQKLNKDWYFIWIVSWYVKSLKIKMIDTLSVWKSLVNYSKTCLMRPLTKKTLKTDYRLMQVKSIAECS